MATPVVTLGTTLPVVNQPASIQVLVTNPAFSPVPTGAVSIDFGDGSVPGSLTLSTTSAQTTHTYTTAGIFTIAASYGGDTNFAPASNAVTTVSVLSAPVYRLTEFGDSLTGGLPATWPAMLVGAQGWSAKDYACGGCKTNDQAPYIYSSVVDGAYASTWLLGQNDAPSTTAEFNQFQQAALAENAWLAIPEGAAKLRTQNSAVTQSGSWAASDVYTTTGLRSTAAGSSLTATLQGSTIYAGLTSLTTTDYTVDVLIDGVDQGAISPVSVYVGEHDAGETYGLRYALGGDRGTAHSVQIVCVAPGTSGCYVDWIGSNGAAAQPNRPPYLWTGVTYRTPQPDPNDNVDARSGIVRSVESELESDGLAIRVADIESLFSGVALPQCVGDGVHPNDCGNQIEETVWLSAMNYLATEAQRIDLGPVTPAVVGTPLTLDEGAATSGLPVSYSVVSGPATIAGAALTANGPGTIVVQGDQAGNATVLPAASVRFSIAAQLATGTTLSTSSTSVYTGASLTITANVVANGSPVTAGSITFYDGTSVLASVALDPTGTAALSTTALAIGTNLLSASFGGNTAYLPSASAPITVTVLPPADFSLSASPAQLTVQDGQSGTTSIIVTPTNGFNSLVSLSCSGLPASAACSFGSPTAQTDGSMVYPLTIHAGSSAAVRSAGGTPPLYGAVPFALLLPLWRRKRRGMRQLYPWLLVGLLAVASVMSGCTASSPKTPVSATVTVTANAQSGLTHSIPINLTVE
ncbi:MAG TPA: Ig-like domain-containing protein [Terracidiphilus sp.]|nr:Ig-like domain-containing protein [Terracidiphilus sp.]